MPFNASGVFQRLFSWSDDRDAGTKILADRMDQETDGIAAAINDIVQGRAIFSGQIRGSFGTVGSPAFSFIDDDTTGFYRSSTNKLAASAGGTQVVEFRADEFEVLENFKKGTFAIDGDFLSFENGNHWITYNDGAGAFNIRAGNKHDGSDEVHTADGQGSIHLELDHDGSDPRFTLQIGTPGVLGEPVSWVQDLTGLASGELTWSGNTIWHAGNTNDAPFLRTDTANPSVRMGSADATNWDGIRYDDSADAFRFFADQDPDNDNPVFEISKLTGISFLGAQIADQNGKARDADLLDGQQGSYYRDAGNLSAGTVPLARLPTGSGSGLDADQLDGQHGDAYLRRDIDSGMEGLLRMERSGGEQIRLGYNTGAERNAFMSFYDGESTRRGFIQARSDRMRLGNDGGAELDLLGGGDARLNGWTVRHTGIAAGSIGSEVFALNSSGSTLSYGDSVAGSNLSPAGESDGERRTQGISLSGTWECRGYAPQNFNTQFVRVA